MKIRRDPSRWRIVVGLAVLATVLLLASCGDDSDDAATGDDAGASTTTADTSSDTAARSISVTDLEGRTFAATEADGQEVVVGSTIVVEFVDGRVVVNAGCNTMSGPFDVEDGRLLAGDVMSTMMGCDDALMAQDQWIGELLAAEPTITLDGDTLTLASDDVTLVLVEEAPVPDADLVGPTWTAESIVDADAVSTVAGDPPTFTFADDGTVEVFDGCSTTSATYVLDGDVIRFTAGELGPGCPPDAPTDWADAVRPLLSGSPVTSTIEGDQLSLRLPDGSGLDLRAGS